MNQNQEQKCHRYGNNCAHKKPCVIEKHYKNSILNRKSGLKLSFHRNFMNKGILESLSMKPRHYWGVPVIGYNYLVEEY